MIWTRFVARTLLCLFCVYVNIGLVRTFQEIVVSLWCHWQLSLSANSWDQLVLSLIAFTLANPWYWFDTIHSFLWQKTQENHVITFMLSSTVFTFRRFIVSLYVIIDGFHISSNPLYPFILSLIASIHIPAVPLYQTLSTGEK